MGILCQEAEEMGVCADGRYADGKYRKCLKYSTSNLEKGAWMTTGPLLNEVQTHFHLSPSNILCNLEISWIFHYFGYAC